MPVIRRRRMTDHQEVDTEGSWAISYGDMITLLLTFFILFFSTDKEKDRMQTMNATLLALLNSTDSKTPDQPPGQDPMMERLVAEKLNAKAFKLGGKLVVEFPGVSFFKLGAVDLTSEGRTELGKFIRVYMPYAGNYRLNIHAYTDHKKVRPTARFTDNLELSALRSISAMRFLQKNGLPLRSMRLGGYGELNLNEEELSRAIASTPNYALEGLGLARKIVLVIEPEPKESL